MARQPSPPAVTHDDTDGILLGPPPMAAPAGDWGPAALATAGILLVAGFPGILVVMILAMNWDHLIAWSDADLTAVIGYAGYSAGFVTALMTVAMAIRGLVGAVRGKRTLAWAVPAGLVALLAVIVWGIALFGWHKCIEDVHSRRQFQQIVVDQPPVNPW
jgi:hypothetical protein